MLDGGEYSASSVMNAGTECFISNFSALSKKKRVKNKRRFSDQQIKSLETIFESESKLEPRKKLQLARELGLQPRQVAIWFQNKRARWKSKQLERDYSILLASYNTLASQFETLKKEKQSLLLQLQKLNDMVEKSNREGRQCCSHGKAKSGTNCELEDKGGSAPVKAEMGDMAYQSLVVGSRHGHGVGVLSDEDTDSSIKAEYLGLDELKMVEPTYSSLTSPENWGSLDSDGLINQSGTCTSQWWDFWT